MGLTLEGEQRMAAVGIVQFYDKGQAAWLNTVVETKKYVKGNFPKGAEIRRDDVAKALLTIVEVHEGFQAFRNAKKLRGKFWNSLFVDLLVDRTWDKLG